MKKIVLTCMIIGFLIALGVVGVWYWGIPDDYVSEKLESLAINPLSVTVEGFSKKPFFAFNAEKVLIRKNNQEVWLIDRLAGDMVPLQFIKGLAVINVRGESYEGIITGRVRAGRNDQQVMIELNGVQASEIAYLRSHGFDVRGLLSGSLSYSGGAGRLEFVLDDAILKGIKSNGIFVPLEFFHTVRGAIELKSPDSADIKSITLIGKDIYVRMKGTLSSGFANLAVEIMPETTFPEPSLLMLIERYKISDGYYFIPVKRTL